MPYEYGYCLGGYKPRNLKDEHRAALEALRQRQRSRDRGRKCRA